MLSADAAPPCQVTVAQAADPCNASKSCLWSSEAEIGWHWPMLVFGSVLLTDSTEICLFGITSLGWSQILAKINEGDVCLLLLSIFAARESQCLQWSHLAKSLGQAANFEVQLTTTTQQQHNSAFYAASTCTWELCSGGGDLLKVQSGHSIGPRKLWNAGALTCVIHPYLLYNELLNSCYSNCISSKTMASQKLGNQRKGFSPFIAGWRLHGIQSRHAVYLSS